MKTLHALLIFFAALALAPLAGCIEDGFTTNPSDVLAFSTDTVAFDTVITGMGTPTKQFLVKNKSKKQLNISSIKVAGISNGHFFINVDGMKGEEFHDVELRGEDSIYVFVESRLDPTNVDEPQYLLDRIDFETNGVKQSVYVEAWGQDAIILDNVEVKSNRRLYSNKPYLVYGDLIVYPDATLTLEAGSTLLFHKDAALYVAGKLTAKGAVGKPITLRGDRLDHVVGGIGFDIMAGQWGGVVFAEGSYNNELQYVEMRGSSYGVQVYSADASKRSLHMLNSVLHNSSSGLLVSVGAWVEAEGSEFSDCYANVLYLEGGKARLANCTVANYYLFDAIAGPMLFIATVNEDSVAVTPDARFDNCIIQGLTAEVNMPEYIGYEVYFRHCLLKSNGTDDANFINCRWGGDAKFYTEREKYIFDYRLRNQSDAIAIGDRSLCPATARYDRYGVDRFARDGIDIGAYAWVPSEEE